MLGTEWPATGAPAAASLSDDLPFQRQGVAYFCGQACAEQAAKTLTLQRIIQFAVGRVQVDGQPALLPQVITYIFIAGHNQPGINTQLASQGMDKGFTSLARQFSRCTLIGQPLVVVPQGQAVLPPVQRQGPARQWLTGIPFALADMHQAVAGIMTLQAPEQLVCEFAFVISQGLGIPLGAVHIVDGDKRWLTAHGQAHIIRGQLPVDFHCQLLDLLPLDICIGFGDPRIFIDARHTVFKVEGYLGWLCGTGHRRCRYRVRRTGQWNMTLTGKQA